MIIMTTLFSFYTVGFSFELVHVRLSLNEGIMIDASRNLTDRDIQSIIIFNFKDVYYPIVILFMSEIISLSTKRLIIRELEWDDLNFVHALHSLPEVQMYATLGVPESLTNSKDYLKKYIEQQINTSRNEYGFCVLSNRNTPIGLVGLNNPLDKFKNAEIWFKLHPMYWGKGYTTEAALKLLEFGFNKLLLHRLEAGVATENLASIKVLEKIGMKREGLRRKLLPIRGEWKDNFHYAILEEDFLKSEILID
jgi:ribosomal-protein-alanine N-acetyltransferase